MSAETAVDILLGIENLLVRRGGATVLDIPVFEVREGEALALIGPNGAGKSSLLLCLAGLLKPERGRLFLRGKPIDNSGVVYRRRIAMVFQEPLLFDATVFENVTAGLKIRGERQEETARLVPEALERFGVGHLAKRSARKLSGGEAQRVSLARAFATKPEVVFLDEPFSSLDPPTREALTADLEKILRETRTAAVISTHDLTEALRLADRLAVVNGGRIIQTGTVFEVINRPADEFVASFVGVETMLPGRVVGTADGALTVALGEGPEIAASGEAPVGAGVLCCIRPEYVELSVAEQLPAAGVRNSFPGRVVRITPAGPVYRVRLDCGFELSAFVGRNSLEELGLKEGGAAIASFRANSVHIISRS